MEGSKILMDLSMILIVFLLNGENEFALKFIF